MKRRGRRAAALLAMGVVAAVAAVGGYAYWTTTGEGATSAAVASDTPWLVTVGDAQGSPLTPGGPNQRVGYTVKNTTGGYLYLNAVTVTIENADGSPWSSGTCGPEDFSLNEGPAGTPLVDTRLTRSYEPGEVEGANVWIQLVDSPKKNQNDCKGVPVPLQFVAS